MKDMECKSLKNLATKILLGYFSTTLVSTLISTLISISPCVAQSNIAPDNTLGSESSRVTPNINNPDGIPSELIEGGAQRGKNLFHSLREFNIIEGRGAYFVVPNNGIANVLTRVTGINPSSINGILGTISDRNFNPANVNLFLINPNGIIFGRNASLDVNGSFVGSTANAFKFGNQGFFSATNPEQSLPLLTIDPSALLFNQIQVNKIQNAAIQNNSQFALGLTRAGDFNLERTGLRVPDGKSLLLVGGEINSNGGGLNAYEGRIELGAIASSGTVGLNISNQDISLNFPNDVTRGNVILKNESSIDVWGADKGNIRIYAKELNIADRTRVLAGIAKFKGQEGSQAGNIDLNVTDTITLERLGRLENSTGSSSIGNAGEININTNRLTLETGGQIQADNNGLGRGGDININAGDVLIDGIYQTVSSGMFTRILDSGNGEAGDIRINAANSMTITNSGQMLTQALGKTSEAGNVIINVPNGTVKVAGGSNPETDDGIDRHSAILSSVRAGTIGNGGDINIQAKEFLLIGDELKRNNIKVGRLVSSNQGEGNAGNVTVKASDRIVIDGKDGGIFSTISSSSKGNGGDINLITNPEGNIIINNGSLILASLFGEGIKSGNISISTGQFAIDNNSLILAQTNGKGDSGTIDINATDSVIFDNKSEALSSVLGPGIGNAKTITINTKEFILRDKSVISAETFGEGNASDVVINASIGVTLDDGAIKAQVSATPDSNGGSNDNGGGTGNGGDIRINTSKLRLRNQGELTVNSIELGNAGNINLNAKSIALDNSTISANTQSVNTDPNRPQANINIRSQDLILRRGSNITANARGTNVIGGNIDINTEILAGFENSDIAANSDNFRGGNITINAEGIFGIQFRDIASDLTSDITATGATPELSGDVEITTPEVDPSSGLVELPVNLVDTSNQISNACTPGSPGFDNSFISIGRGGLPMSPTEPLQENNTLSAWVRLKPQTLSRINRRNLSQLTTVSNTPKVEAKNQIVEATGWIIDRDGNIEFVAQAHQAKPKSSWQNPASCSVSQ